LDRPRCEDELVNLVCRFRPDVLIPASEATLRVLSEVRAELSQWTVLAVSPAPSLEYALDRSKAARLAERLEIPVPVTIEGATAGQMLHQATDLRFPVIVRPRSPAYSGFASRRVGSLKDLASLLRPIGDGAAALLVQEVAAGVSRSVAVVCRDGRPE